MVVRRVLKDVKKVTGIINLGKKLEKLHCGSHVGLLEDFPPLSPSAGFLNVHKSSLNII